MSRNAPFGPFADAGGGISNRLAWVSATPWNEWRIVCRISATTERIAGMSAADRFRISAGRSDDSGRWPVTPTRNASRARGGFVFGAGSTSGSAEDADAFGGLGLVSLIATEEKAKQ